MPVFNREKNILTKVNKNSWNFLFDSRFSIKSDFKYICFFKLYTVFEREINILVKVGKSSFNYILDFRYRY